MDCGDIALCRIRLSDLAGGGDDIKRHEELEGYSKSPCGGESVVLLHCMAGGLGGAFESENRIVFALFLPPFVSAGAGEASVQAQLLILGILVPLTSIPSDIVMALLGRTVTKSINENTRARLIMAWISGLLLMAIAVNLHLQFI